MSGFKLKKANLKKLFSPKFRYLVNSWRTCWFLARNDYCNWNQESTIKDFKFRKIEIETQGEKEFNINPSFVYRSEPIEIYFRSTNIAYRPKANEVGIMFKINSEEKEFNSSKKGILKLEEDCYSLVEPITLEFPKSLEDTRIIDFDGTDIVIGTIISAQKDSSTKLLQTKVGVSHKQKFFELDSPVGKRLEKNWVPIEIIDSTLRLLHSNCPMRIIEIDIETGTQNSYLIPGTDKQLKVSGGTPFLKLDDSSFIRVARRRFPLFGRGYVHISFLIHNSSSYKELNVSKPFIFRDFGFEICNGLSRAQNGDLLLSWGYNDSEMFFAEYPYEELSDWFFSNLMKRENRNSFLKSFKIMRKIKSSIE
jgi:hypothetical protein